ncbi:acyl-CoA dehydrogenase family protein [Bosea sp. (in: a-proteobacteria)]|jgi:alkylation response protein AidB-like acyl-CoA dehydrogenase|uniref:acyl-CoA dehydrogenase family protein n=1 Tax=Bosea sp. (in: a-proteobacteria) TaxID=1871050 RepID=UPI002DDD8A5D|nr:acyl-CoA dehydrogenase family protein [Bosea sp. (in: a-proteobacteria)]HEV2512074.1 acyl-CoA dehydrogenase family protein [Bosea sp. (in: a-proteobacteria)]
MNTLSAVAAALSPAAILAAPTDEAFRAGIKVWFAQELPRLAGARHGTAEMQRLAFRREWEDHLCRSGLSGLGWPEAVGGRPLSLTRQAIYHQEYARAKAPLAVNLIGHGIVGPTLIAFGSQEQKDRFIPKLLGNEEIWCQGYSEPNSGSDLASLATRAERRGDVYVLNGQKIWTSFSHLGDWCFLLARTSSEGPRQRGISVFLVDMHLPGIRVRPIRQITGEADYGEVFFDDVEVPVACRLGEENAGWGIAMAAANFERGTYFIPRIVRLQTELEDLVRLAATTQRDGRKTIEDPLIRDAIARLFCDAHALRLHADRMLKQAEEGVPPGVEGSAVKLLWSETHQRLFDLAMDIMGPAFQYGPQEKAAPAEGLWHRDYLWTRAETILAGTSEIQRNIIAERGLELPR